MATQSEKYETAVTESKITLIEEFYARYTEVRKWNLVFVSCCLNLCLCVLLVPALAIYTENPPVVTYTILGIHILVCILLLLALVSPFAVKLSLSATILAVVGLGVMMTIPELNDQQSSSAYPVAVILFIIMCDEKNLREPKHIIFNLVVWVAAATFGATYHRLVKISQRESWKQTSEAIKNRVKLECEREHQEHLLLSVIPAYIAVEYMFCRSTLMVYIDYLVWNKSDLDAKKNIDII